MEQPIKVALPNKFPGKTGDDAKLLLSRFERICVDVARSYKCIVNICIHLSDDRKDYMTHVHFRYSAEPIFATMNRSTHKAVLVI